MLSVHEKTIAFRSFFQAGFECSTHKRKDGKRLDLIAQTLHDRFTLLDYQRVQQFGIRTVRTAARWHAIEATPHRFDFSSLQPTVDAAISTGTEILLDLLHFGWPDHLDIFDPEFPDRFAAFVTATADYLRPYTHIVTTIAPVNEVSYLSWAGGDVADINPLTIGRGHELKRILICTAIAGIKALRAVLPDIRLLAPEPVIHIVGNPERLDDDGPAIAYTLSQYESWDMLSGRLHPELGGRPEYLDILGVNFYQRNQWVNYGPPLERTDPRWRPFRRMLQDVYQRYSRPLIVSETGTEDDQRAGFFDYICDEIFAARELGVPVHGVCLYPICNHPGWADERHCHNGLFDYADEHGHRPIHQPLADALRRQVLKHSEHTHDSTFHRSDLPVPPSLGVRLSTPATLDEPLRADPESVLF